MDNLNISVESDLELAEPIPTLGRQQPLPPDRTTITAREAGDTAFKATLDRVQYGIYKGQRACLITFTFLFYFKAKTRLRFKSARITVRFRRASNIASLLDDDDDEDDEDEPDIVQLAPAQIYGAATETTVQTGWKLDMAAGFQSPTGGPSATIQPGYQKNITETRQERMSIQGRTKSSTGSNIDDIAL